MDYVFKVTGKGSHGAPKGVSVTIVRKYSGKPDLEDNIDAFQKEHGIKVSGTTSSYDIEKL